MTDALVPDRVLIEKEMISPARKTPRHGGRPAPRSGRSDDATCRLVRGSEPMRALITGVWG
jgi:hypothetical protein